MIVSTLSKSVQMLADISTASGSTAGGGTYAAGVSVTLTATAKPGFVFVSWTVANTEVSTNSIYTFNAPASDTTYTANFAPEIQQIGTTGILGISINYDETAVFDWQNYQAIQKTTGLLGLSINFDETVVFPGSFYQPIQKTTGILGVGLNYDDTQINELQRPQVIRSV